jgi:hypothetical protein
MTAVFTGPETGAIVTEASEADIRKSMQRALERAGVSSYNELAEQARARRFTSTAAHLAWIAFGDLGAVQP